jgi:hypothetical protein
MLGFGAPALLKSFGILIAGFCSFAVRRYLGAGGRIYGLICPYPQRLTPFCRGGLAARAYILPRTRNRTYVKWGSRRVKKFEGDKRNISNLT